MGCVAAAAPANWDGGAGAPGAVGGNNLGLAGSAAGGAGAPGGSNFGLSGDASGGPACQQDASGANLTSSSPACLTGNGGDANGASPGPGGAGGTGLGGNGGDGADATGGVGGDGAGACFETGSCFNDNS
jgi:hypothetical protein